MKAYDESMYWLENNSWVKVDNERDCLELTSEAPPRAVASFRLYLERNHLPITDPLVLMGVNIGQ